MKVRLASCVGTVAALALVLSAVRTILHTDHTDGQLILTLILIGVCSLVLSHPDPPKWE